MSYYMDHTFCNIFYLYLEGFHFYLGENQFHQVSIDLTKSLILSPRVQWSHQESIDLTKSLSISPSANLTKSLTNMGVPDPNWVRIWPFKS